ncbi:MAG: phosphotriesterase [Cytophagaceae bacterium]|nr:phosphotriesterase [Cytophagaceae bacterium]
MRRRTFLKSTPLLLSVPTWRVSPAMALTGTLQTVTGSVQADQLGICLPHEHLFSSFGLDGVGLTAEETETIFQSVNAYLLKLKGFGCTTIMDCTAAYFGRNPKLLKRLSEASGIHILTNTGIYGAANDRYVPPFAYDETADQLAARWVSEFREGIQNTDIKPGFLKIGVDPAPLSELDRKLVQAACRTHRQSGLTIACHTSGNDGQAALEELEIVKTEGLKPEAWIWVHAQNCADSSLHQQVAQQGGWVSFDGLQAGQADKHLKLVQAMKEARLLNRVMLSHDGNSFRIRNTDTMRPYDLLFQTFIPMLKRAGFTETDIRQMTVLNPAEAFSIRIRTA